MARDPTNPVDPTPDDAQDTMVDPSNLSTEDSEGMTPEQYLDALAKVPGGVFFDIPADVNGALDPDEEVYQFSDLPVSERAPMLAQMEAKRRQREEQTVDLSAQDASKLKDQIESKRG